LVNAKVGDTHTVMIMGMVTIFSRYGAQKVGTRKEKKKQEKCDLTDIFSLT
jgi:hypothetical protein